MLSISAAELHQKIVRGDDIILIDVRESFEHDFFNIGGTLIPLGTLFENSSLIPNDKPVVLYCQKGIRSMIAIQRLQKKFGYDNLINLSGGMDAWKREVQPI